MESNENDRLVEGFGNVSIVDNQGDFVPIKRMAEIMPIYMRRGAILMDSHTNRHIGTILNWELRDKEGKDAIYLWAKIFNDFSIDDMVWKAIGNKHYTGFSFGGRSVSKDIKCSGGACFNNIKDLEMWEWSTVPKPANKESTFTKFNELVKGDKMSTVLVPRVQDGSVIYDQVDMSLGDDYLTKSDDEMEKASGPGSRGPESKDIGDKRRGINLDGLRSNADPDDGEMSIARMHSKNKPTSNYQNRKNADMTSAKDRSAETKYRRDHKRQNRTGKFPEPMDESGTFDEESEKMDDYQSPNLDQETEKMDDYKEKEFGGPGSRGPKSREMGYRTSDYKPTERTNEVKRPNSREPEKISNESEKEDNPMTPPESDAGNPINKILSILESIDGRLTVLEGGESEEKAELEDIPPEAEKAETPKKVTVPEPPAQQEVKTLQKGSSISPSMLNSIAGELKKMGYEQASTPRPSVSAEYPFGTGNTVGDLLNKSDGGLVDIHSQLGEKSFKDIDLMFGGN